MLEATSPVSSVSISPRENITPKLYQQATPDRILVGSIAQFLGPFVLQSFTRPERPIMSGVESKATITLKGSVEIVTEFFGTARA